MIQLNRVWRGTKSLKGKAFPPEDSCVISLNVSDETMYMKLKVHAITEVYYKLIKDK